MKERKFISLVLFGVLIGSSAFALTLGSNITINDQIKPLVDYEDQEIDFGSITSDGQGWDVEAFFLNGYDLSLVGGWDFENGRLYNGIDVQSGDIFVDVGVAPAPVIPGDTGSGTWGYDYVLDIDWDTKLFDIVNLNLGAPVVLEDAADRDRPDLLAFHRV